jgi:hypothetical protein
MGRSAVWLLLLLAQPAHADATLPEPATGAAEVGRDGLRIGALVRIVDAGQVYPSINRTDCASRWPSEAIRAAAGEEYWARVGFAPKNGDVGEVIGEARHCFEPHVRLLVLRVGARYVMVGANGLALRRPAAK